MGFRIIIVDDDEDLLSTFSQALSNLDVEFVLCRNGYELIQALNSNDLPALVFLDVHMDQMNGIEAVEELKMLRKCIRLRFITGGESVHAIAARMIARARDLNVGRTLFKPFPMGQLLEAIEEDGKLLLAD